MKAADKPQKHFDGGGLFLLIPKTGSKLWRMAYRFDGKSKLLSFGEYPTVSLKNARQRRDDAKRLLAQGIDPEQQKKQIREARMSEEQDTFQNIAVEWHGSQAVEFTAKHRTTVMFRLQTYLFGPIGNLHITKVEPWTVSTRSTKRCSTTFTTPQNTIFSGFNTCWILLMNASSHPKAVYCRANSAAGVCR